MIDNPVYAELSNAIPYGEENAIKRHELVRKFRLSDRKIRDLIAEIREETVILSSPKGGYYKPTPEEAEKIKSYIKKEEKRAKSIFLAVKYARAYCQDIEKGRI